MLWGKSVGKSSPFYGELFSKYIIHFFLIWEQMSKNQKCLPYRFDHNQWYKFSWYHHPVLRIFAIIEFLLFFKTWISWEQYILGVKMFCVHHFVIALLKYRMKNHLPQRWPRFLSKHFPTKNMCTMTYIQYLFVDTWNSSKKWIHISHITS